MVDFDLAVIGGGPGGMTAVIYARRKNLKTAIFEKGLFGGNTALSPLIENFPGFKAISGSELSKRIEEQMMQYKPIVINEEVKGLELNGNEKIIKTDKGSYSARAVIIATGTKYRQLGKKGEKEFLGKGVFYCTICDAPLMRGKEVAVVGGGNTALSSAIYLSELCPKIYLIHRRDAFRGDEELQKQVMSLKNVELVLDSEVEEIKGNLFVDTVVVRNKKTGEKRELKVSGLFVQVGEDPNSELAERAGIELDERKRIKVNQLQETNIKGVYAVGDVCNTYAQTVIAAGHGASAALRAYDYIKYGK
ncbi:thioredoxin-disulfide reductase [Candidatus Micrarchaeota archaeon]|nr:MAG: thioredoxin-disulfide reductase [Candidatus Micrarchaeota archaeon]